MSVKEVVLLVRKLQLFFTALLKITTMSVHTYKTERTKCYNFSFDTNHDTSYEFSNEELFLLTPDHIYAYLAHKVFRSLTHR